MSQIFFYDRAIIFLHLFSNCPDERKTISFNVIPILLLISETVPALSGISAAWEKRLCFFYTNSCLLFWCSVVYLSKNHLSTMESLSIPTWRIGLYSTNRHNRPESFLGKPLLLPLRLKELTDAIDFYLNN